MFTSRTRSVNFSGFFVNHPVLTGKNILISTEVDKQSKTLHKTDFMILTKFAVSYVYLKLKAML